MDTYVMSHVSNEVLKRELSDHVARDRRSFALLLAELAEFDARRLYLPAAFSSMQAYCIGELGYSEDAANKRIRVARAARKFPAIFEAIAEGRLNPSAVIMLKPYLTKATADELLASAAHQSNEEIRRLIANRFPQADLPEWLQAIPQQMGLNRAEPEVAARPPRESDGEVAARPPAVPRPEVEPLSPQRFGVKFTMGQNAHDKLRYAQALFRHQIPSGDIAEIFERSLEALIEKAEKRKYAATRRPRAVRETASARHVPAHVRRAVWERDEDQCTFISHGGRRCEARELLEFDHVTEVARGGVASVQGVRLRCRAHNQYTAECTFGSEFMRQKRLAAIEERAARRRAAAEPRAAAQEAKARTVADARDVAQAARANASEARAAEKAARECAAAEERDPDRSVIPWLRQLGFGIDEARRAAESCESMGDTSLEERVRAALSHLSKARPQRSAPKRAA